MKKTPLRDIFKDKHPPFVPGEQKAWILHGPFGAAQNRVADELERSLPVHTQRSVVRIDDAHDAAGQLSRAMKGRYSLIAAFDPTDPGDTAPGWDDMMRRLGQAGYHTTLVSCWAPLDVCLQRDVAFEPHLLTSRLAAFETFDALQARANATQVYYSTAPERIPGEVLNSARLNLGTIDRRVTTRHIRLLRQMMQDLGREGLEPRAEWLDGALAEMNLDRARFARLGARLAASLRVLGGELLAETRAVPGVPRGL